MDAKYLGPKSQSDYPHGDIEITTHKPEDRLPCSDDPSFGGHGGGSDDGGRNPGELPPFTIRRKGRLSWLSLLSRLLSKRSDKFS